MWATVCVDSPAHASQAQNLLSRSLLCASSVQAKQGYCIYRVRVKRGDRKKRVAKAQGCQTFKISRCFKVPSQPESFDAVGSWCVKSVVAC